MPELFPRLTQALDEKSPELQNIISGLISGLSRFNGSTQKAVPFLLEGATNPEMNDYIRFSSKQALKRFAPQIAAKAGLN